VHIFDGIIDNILQSTVDLLDSFRVGLKIYI